MEKYYTPTIEEFHVGFEFEVDYGKGRWIKEALHYAPQVVTLPYMVLENIRVKYLDREDIESFGFEFVKDTKNKKLYSKDNVLLIHFTEKRIGIFTADPSKSDIFSRTNVDPIAVNYIYIKNKSEFKKLLKQLKIIV